MAYWYGQFVTKTLTEKGEDQISEHELCVLAAIGSVLEGDDYRSLSKPAFNKKLAEAVKSGVLTDLQLREHWLAEAKKYASEEAEATQSTLRLPEAKIHKVTIRNFRSFGDSRSLEVCDESNMPLNRLIIFGPNGSGKSSVCEAMEREMTGYIRECDRRKLSLAEYSRRHSCEERPEVSVEYSPEAEIDENQKRLAKSCFIEKNRIENFSLLANSKESRDVIAVLIGLEDLKKIADEIMIRSDSCGIAKTENLFVAAKNALEEWQKTSRTIEVEIQAAQQNEANAAKELMTLLGIEDGQWEIIQSRRSKLNEKIENLSERHDSLKKITFAWIDKEDFASVIERAIATLKTRESLLGKIAEQGANVDFKQIYTAVRSLGANDQTACPACDTPLDSVTKNPFTKAEEELPKLKELEELQDQLGKNGDALVASLREITEALNNQNQNAISSVEWLCSPVPELQELVEEYRRTYAPFFPVPEKELSQEIALQKLQSLMPYVLGLLQSLGLEVDQHSASQSALTEEMERYSKLLRATEDDLADLNRKYSNWQQWHHMCAENEVKNKLHLAQKADLEKQVEVEQQKNDFLKGCSEAYAEVYSGFVAYKHEIEKERTQGIQDSIAHYYQMINASDGTAEHVEAVTIQVPDEEHDQYSIKLQCQDGSEKDAMHVLSEGHLRSLGLAIMLAIAKRYDLPFLIFDDAVNAIDSDHRANIIEMMFTDDYLQDTQIIVTTHDRLFWERFCLELGKAQDNDDAASGASYIVTYPENNQGSVFAQYNINFESKIEAALTHFDLRQAMVYLRIWVETEILSYITRHTDGRLSGRLLKSKSRRFRGNALEPDIQGMFGKISPLISSSEQGVQDAWAFLRTELIDEILNQDSHTYSEALLNVSHAKTSSEVQSIYDNAKVVIGVLRNPPDEASS